MSYLVKREKSESKERESRWLKKWVDSADAGVVVVVGDIGSGKTAFALRLLQLTDRDRRIFVAPKLKKEAIDVFFDVIPDAEIISRLDEIGAGVCMVDEAALNVAARRAMSSTNVTALQLAAIARHKQALILYLTQASRLIDVGLLLLARDIVIKRLPWYFELFERKELVRLVAERFGYQYNRLKKLPPYAGYVVGRDFEQPKYFRFRLPAGWNDRISRFMAGYRLGEDEDEVTREILRLREEGYSYRQIARELGVSYYRVYKVLSGRG